MNVELTTSVRGIVSFVDSMRKTKSKYVPALRFHWLTRIYDPVVAFTTRDSVFRQAVTDEVAGSSPSRILDLACGTGTLALMLKPRLPVSDIVGLDADPAVLERARAKAGQAGVEVTFDQGMSFDMPYEDGSFDVVASCLFFHHLTTKDKAATLAEVARVLTTGGRLVVCDWGKPSNVLLRTSFGLVRLLDGFDRTRDNAGDRLSEIIASAGFKAVTVRNTITAPLGTLELLTAERV